MGTMMPTGSSARSALTDSNSASENESSGVVGGIREAIVDGNLILSPANGRIHRRVLYLNSYGGVSIWERIKQRVLPTHHLWGCTELARMGYEVMVCEALPHFNARRPIPHDIKWLRIASQWLGPDGLVYSGHTLLYWIPFLKKLGFLRRHVVSLTYAREDLDFAPSHSAIIALTPAAADQARKIAPSVKVAHLAWGGDLTFYPTLPYQPNWFLSCGKTHRDHEVVNRAAVATSSKIRLICPKLPPELRWPSNVSIDTGGECDDTVSYDALLNDYYARCTASLIILKRDPEENTAVGFTNLIEAMSMARPVIVTRTGALASELDVEKAGCGLHVPAGDPDALVVALRRIAEDPEAARAMGKRGRELCERHYNIHRYSFELHQLFESIG